MSKNSAAQPQVIMRNVNELTPHPANPRQHTHAQVAQIMSSMEQWGWTIPVLVDENSQILAGHGRVIAAKQLGIEMCPTIVAVGWSEEKKQAYLVADNQLAHNSEWDKAKLSAELKLLQEAMFDTRLTGFVPEFVNQLTAEVQAPNIGTVNAPDNFGAETLEWAKHMVPMTSEETKLLDAALKKHVHTTRSRSWFFDNLLKGAINV